MMPREQGGVVDARLNVYGVEGLKVAGTRQSRLPEDHALRRDFRYVHRSL